MIWHLAFVHARRAHRLASGAGVPKNLTPRFVRIYFHQNGTNNLTFVRAWDHLDEPATVQRLRRVRVEKIREAPNDLLWGLRVH